MESSKIFERLPTAIACVIRFKSPTLLALDHALQYFDALLDVSTFWTLEAAVAHGSLRLFERVYDHTLALEAAAPTDGCFVEYKLSVAAKAAVTHGHLDIIQYIHHVHPQKLPVRLCPLAAATGNLPMLRWLMAHYKDELCTPDDRSAGNADPHIEERLPCCPSALLSEAIKTKQFAMVKWLVENGYYHASRDFFHRAGDDAASAGDLEMVKWYHQRNHQQCFTSAAIDQAARNGHLPVVEFLLENRAEGWTCEAINGAILEDHPRILALLRCSSGGPQNEQATVPFAIEAARMGRVDIFDRPCIAGATGGGSLGWLHAAIYMACQMGHLPLVQRLVVHHGTMTVIPAGAICRAASHGRLHILEWIHSQEEAVGSYWTCSVIDSAARSGQLAVVKWLHLNRKERCSSAAMDGACENGHLEVVQWLHENESAFQTATLTRCTSAAMDKAAQNNHHKVVEFLHSHRNEGCTSQAMDGACANGHFEMVRWLHIHRREGCTPKAMDAAPLYLVKFLHFNRNEGCTTQAMDHAALAGDLVKLQFLRTHRSEGCTQDAVIGAARNGHLYILQWLYEWQPELFDGYRQAMVARGASGNKQDPHRHFPQIGSWLQRVGIVAPAATVAVEAEEEEARPNEQETIGGGDGAVAA